MPQCIQPSHGGNTGSNPVGDASKNMHETNVLRGAYPRRGLSAVQNLSNIQPCTGLASAARLAT